MHITFASTDIIAKKSMPVARSFSAVSNVPPVQPATRHVRTLSKNDVTDSIKHLMCVMVVQKQSITARLPTNTAMMLFLLTANTKECLSQSRAGINMTRHELHQKDMVITPLIFQGQSPYQIITNHPELDMSVRTLYSYLDKGILSARNIDLKRQVKFKPRKVHKTQIKDRSVFIRRMFSDFQALELDHFAEMDTVHSSQDSKRVILTFFLTREKLFLAFIMNRCTKGAVKLVFNKLEHQLGTYDFLTLFNTILTDRGSEFGDPESLENGINGIMRSSIYYCDPMRSGQKGGIEQTHTMLRMILPKKTSFEYLTQWDLRTIVDHINSTPRESLGGRTPYDVALENYGIDILKALQLRPIPPDEVNLTPKLIRFNH